MSIKSYSDHVSLQLLIPSGVNKFYSLNKNNIVRAGRADRERGPTYHFDIVLFDSPRREPPLGGACRRRDRASRRAPAADTNDVARRRVITYFPFARQSAARPASRVFPKYELDVVVVLVHCPRLRAGVVTSFTNRQDSGKESRPGAGVRHGRRRPRLRSRRRQPRGELTLDN